MLTIKKEGIILKKTNDGFENDGVLYPTVIKNGENTHLFYRALRKGNYSSIGYCKLKNYSSVEDRLNIPVRSPQFDYEKQVVENSRNITLEDTYIQTFTEIEDIDVLSTLIISKDLINRKKRSLIFPQNSYHKLKLLAESKGPKNQK